MTKVNDEILQEMIRSCSNAEDVQEFVSRAGLELNGPELRAVMAVVDFRAAGLLKEASANRRAAFLGRVALQRERGQTGRPWNPWIRRMAVAAAGVAALAVAAVVGANAERVGEAVGEAVGLRDGKNVYHTTSFEPAFSVTLPELPGSARVPGVAVAVDRRDVFLPAYSWLGFPGTGRFLSGPFLFGVYKPLGWADPGGEAVYIIPGDPIAWLQKHACLDAGEPESPVDIGGVERTQIDAAWTCAPGAPGESTLFYLEREDSLDLGPDWQPPDVEPTASKAAGLRAVNITPGVRYRFWFLEVQGEDLVIVAPAPPESPCIPIPHRDCPDLDFDRVIQPMIDSLVFE